MFQYAEKFSSNKNMEKLTEFTISSFLYLSSSRQAYGVSLSRSESSNGIKSDRVPARYYSIEAML